MEASIGVGIIISVAFICITFLMYNGKLGTFSWSKAGGVSIEANCDGNIPALLFLDELLDTAERNFKRNMINSPCFKENLTGLKHAMNTVAINHCLRDLASIGYNNYKSRHQLVGNWSESEAECFMLSLITAGRQLVDERLYAYFKCKELKSCNMFKQILESKIQKNLHYSIIIDGYLEEQGIKSNVNSGIVQLLKREQSPG